MKSHKYCCIACVVVSMLLVDAAVSQQSGREIAAELGQALQKPSTGPSGFPLPFLSHWTTGKHDLSEGWAPERQLELLDAGLYILPWFEFPDGSSDEPIFSMSFSDYYEAPLLRAKELHIPISLVGSQWERFLSEDPYLDLDRDANPNVVTPNGLVLPKLSPFGGIQSWRELGFKLTSHEQFSRLQEFYPEPPRVVFVSNNEHSKLVWEDAEDDIRYLEQYGLHQPAEFKRQVFASGWTERYRALFEGMRAGMSASSWRQNSIFVGYDAFGPPHFGRWNDWADYSLYTSGNIDPSVFMWDGATVSYYVHNWSEVTDFTIWSPQVESMNWVFQLAEAYERNPNFWFELSIWDGYVPSDPAVDKRTYYASIGQTYSPERYVGLVQFGMWLLRPRVVREFRDWIQGWNENSPYFLALAEAVGRVHRNAVLRDWWINGATVANDSRLHPYQSSIPREYSNANRWFLLESNVNDLGVDDRIDVEVAVYALALVQGDEPDREWLVYAHSPLGDRENVQLNIPGFGEIVVDVEVGGSFILVSEKASETMQVSAL